MLSAKTLRTRATVTGLALAGTLLLSSFVLCQGRFDPKTYKGPTCRITAPQQGDAQILLRPVNGRGMTQVTLKNGKGIAPAGKYQLMDYQVQAKKGPDQWYASCTSLYRKPRVINLRPKSTVSLPVGGPYTASVKVNKGDDQVRMDLNVVGRSGDTYVIRKISGKAEDPGFQVLDKSGKLVWRGSFKYG